MDLQNKFILAMEGLVPGFRKQRWLLAVSGGLDSVVLADLCNRSGLDFSIAHCNFQLRGEESNRDAAFVEKLAGQYQRPFLLKNMETEAYAAGQHCSIQVAARELRYNWFRELLTLSKNDPFPFAGLLTAHHADDNIETVAMNFFRGTGLAGLRGMQPVTGDLLRPLLAFRRTDLEEFAADHQLQWVEDSSNSKDAYTRNYFRNQLLPAIEKVYPGTAQRLQDSIPRYAEAEQLYQQALAIHKKKLLNRQGNSVQIPVEALRKTVPLTTIAWEIFHEYGFTAAQVPELLSLLDSSTGKSVASATHQVIRNRRWLLIAPIGEPDTAIYTVDVLPESIQCPSFSFSAGLGMVPGSLKQEDPSVAYVDAAAVKLPMLLRRWKAGDYFYPLGMKKKKKIARFLIDQKLSKAAKENVWVLLSGDKIVWVCGLRVDERVKVLPSTKSAVRLTFTSL